MSNKYSQRLKDADARGHLGHTTKSVLKLQAIAYDEGCKDTENNVMDWDSFREWYKKRYGWYPSDSIPMAFGIYLKEKKNEQDKTRAKETAHVLPG